VKMAFVHRTLAMLSGVALATVFVAGCTEETPPPAANPATPPSAASPAKPGGDIMKPTAPPVTTPVKPEEKK
jgi:hypothetical protein